ncbi:MAG: hypothetical protein IKF17_00410 [Clostridia bacterium]|nr:hypothetical protein [Clostridia bacterium]
MNIDSELKKEGIEVVSQLNTLEVNAIAKNVANRLVKTFNDFGLNQTDLFMKLSKLNMYKAKMPEGMSEANYFYKNTSIYFNEHIPDSELEEFAIHECIHYLQEVRDKKNLPIRMGLCNFTEFKLYGLGINEAAVQLMASRVIGIPKEEVKYFGINFLADSPSYYPLECTIVKQMAYVVGGEDILFESTINSNDTFKNMFIEATSEGAYYAIEDALDKILHKEEEIIKINNRIHSFDDRNQKVDTLVKKIDEHKHDIMITFLRTQNLIMSRYFDSAFNKITNLEELENYRKKLQKFLSLLGTTDGYTFSNNYYVEKMAQLEHKYNVLENGGIETAIVEVKTSKFMTIIRTLKRILFGNKETQSQKSNQ